MSATLLQPETQTFLTRYAKDRQHVSFAQMKRDLGDAQAIALEIAYQGEELKEIAAMALVQANRILVALNKPEIIAWPKGWFDVPQGDCDSCGKPGYCRTISVGVTFPMDCDACHRCRGEEIDESEYRLTTPLEVALDLRAYSTDDFWYVETSNEDAVTIASSHSSFDVLDLDRNCVLTVRQAMYLLDRESQGVKEKFGITLPEELSGFLSRWTDGIFPSLVEG